MDLSVFLSPSVFHDDINRNFAPGTLGQEVSFYYEGDSPLEGFKLALIGVQEDRNSTENGGSANGPDEIRSALYRLMACDDRTPMVDLGNILPGGEVKDSYYALEQICTQCYKNGVIPIVLGGSQDLTIAAYRAYQPLEQTINVVAIDSSIDFGSTPDDTSAEGYLNSIILHRPNFLFNFSNLGHQRYLTDKNVIDLAEKMCFDVHRLGEIQQDMTVAEPIIRNADLVSFDLASIRFSEFPATKKSSPNGFFGHEAAQLCRYAGMSEKLSSIGFYEYNPAIDERGHGAQLVAQMIWYFIEGFHSRRGDYPEMPISEYEKFIVLLTESGDELVFYKSHLTNRWWMEVTYPAGYVKKYDRHHIVPCTYKDYLTATQQEMPDRWWKTYQKLV